MSDDETSDDQMGDYQMPVCGKTDRHSIVGIVGLCVAEVWDLIIAESRA